MSIIQIFLKAIFELFSSLDQLRPVWTSCGFIPVWYDACHRLEMHSTPLTIMKLPTLSAHQQSNSPRMFDNRRQQETTGANCSILLKTLDCVLFLQQWPCKDYSFLQMFAELNASLVWSSPICFWAQWSSRILTHTDDIMHHDGYSSGAWIGWSEQDISFQETGKGHCNLGFI